MLRQLSIRDIVLIDALDLEFERGLNALTGETGAGKSILLDALGLALGARGGAGLVRAGASQGSAIAAFEPAPDHPVHAALREAGLPPTVEDGLILRRTVTAEGRGRAFVNDQPTSTGTLRAIGDMLVETHGQHDDRGLLNPAGHRALLDGFAGVEGEAAEVAKLWRAAKDANNALTAAQAAQEEAARDADYLRHSVDELDELAPEAGEADALDAERRLMQAADKMREEVARAAQVLGLEGAEGAMGDALRRLDHAAPQLEGRLDGPLAALDRAMTELGEAQSGVEAALEALTFDPYRLETVEERLFALRGLGRKHNVQPDDLADLRDKLAENLNAIDAGEGRIAELDAEAEAARARYLSAAEALGKVRRAAAARLDQAVAAELGPLKMERAVFETAVETLPPEEAGPDGIDRIAFTVATNPGSRPGPIGKIASGGELSRFLLALKAPLASSGDVTMIFDEIDRGVGGATADAVGRRLERLAGAGQVLVVTHSPQVAARAACQWRIWKSVEGEATRTSVVRLGSDERVDEIARMLAGETVTAEARGAAEALLAG